MRAPAPRIEAVGRRPAIPVLLSRRSLGLPDPEVGSPGDGAGLERLGTTYAMAQEVRWIDRDTFAIGRWDGTLTLFGLPSRPGDGPRIESAAVSPSWAGLEMITPLTDTAFMTSSDRASIVRWDLSASGLAEPSTRLRYDEAIGVANSGAIVRGQDGARLVTGHASGFLVVWEADGALETFELARTIDVRSADPVPSPYPLWNVRAVVALGGDAVLTGGEDGDLCVVDSVTGRVRSRTRYNASARRGINDVALHGDVALVGNCSVGRDDSNAWTFRIDGDRLERLAHANLVRDRGRPQVFNFSVELYESGGLHFLCATEEGLLWFGEVTDEELVVRGSAGVSSGLGAAVSLLGGSDRLAVVGDNIHLFRVRG